MVRTLFALLVLMLCPMVRAQEDEAPPPKTAATVFEVAEAGDNKFHRAVIKAAIKLVDEKKMRRVELIRLRVAMMSPAFRQQAEDLAIIQMSASGEGDDPRDESGRIDRAAIDWDAIIAFIEKLIPLIMRLIDAFSSIDGLEIYVSADGQPLYAVVSCGDQTFTFAA